MQPRFFGAGWQTGQSHCPCRSLGAVQYQRDRKCLAHAKRRKSTPKTETDEEVPDMTEGVKASFYLRFSDVLGDDPSTAMRKIVDGKRPDMTTPPRIRRVLPDKYCVQQL